MCNALFDYHRGVPKFIHPFTNNGKFGQEMPFLGVSIEILRPASEVVVKLVGILLKDILKVRYHLVADRHKCAIVS